MRIFPHFNQRGPSCPICKTKDDKECTLVLIEGSNSPEDPHLFQADAVHVDCLNLSIKKTDQDQIIYQVIE